MSTIEDALAHDGIVPDEVGRLQIHPGETLVIRFRPDGIMPHQIHEYQRSLDAMLPGVPTLIVIGDELAVLATDPANGEADADA